MNGAHLARAGGQADRGFGVAGGVSGYRRRTYAMLRSMVAATGRAVSAVEVGAGDGWMSRALVDDGVVASCVPVDVVRRREVVVEPVIYDGVRLPYASGQFDLALAVDAAHHADDPEAFVAELGRVARRWIVLKDHTSESTADVWTLRVLDEIGNRRFSIRSPGRYQRGFEWIERLGAQGFTLQALVHPLRCHTGLLGALTNRLQFIAMLERHDAR